MTSQSIDTRLYTAKDEIVDEGSEWGLRRGLLTVDQEVGGEIPSLDGIARDRISHNVQIDRERERG